MPKLNKVVTTVWYDLENMRALRRVFPDSEFVYVDFYDQDRLVEETRNADAAILMGDVPGYLLGENSLKWIHCDHAGLNGSARPEVFARGIPVTGSAGRSAPVLAEHAIYFLFQHCYHTRELLAAQEAGRWGVDGAKNWRGLYGRTVGIVGMGNTGKMAAHRLKAFGMRVIAYNRSPVSSEDIDVMLSNKNGDTLQPLLEQSDFVILTIALTDETYHLFGDETFSKMKPGAFLVNMARGGVVDTEALLRALDSGRLGGAGLDVVEPEPLPADHPLWRYPNVYITPHCTPQVPNRAGRSIEIIRENARRFEAGEPLLNLLRPSDAVTVAEAKGGWARLMNTKLTREQAAQMNLEKYLGKRGWTDPAEWM